MVRIQQHRRCQRVKDFSQGGPFPKPDSTVLQHCQVAWYAVLKEFWRLIILFFVLFMGIQRTAASTAMKTCVWGAGWHM